MNTARKTVTAEIVSFGKSPLLDLLDGHTPDQVIEIMQAIKQKYINREVYFIESYIGNDSEKTISLFEQRLPTALKETLLEALLTDDLRDSDSPDIRLMIQAYKQLQEHGFLPEK